MNYRALFRGKVIEVRVPAGSHVKAGDIVAKITTTDKKGRPDPGSTAIKAPCSGTVHVFVDQGGNFDEDQPLFRVEP